MKAYKVTYTKGSKTVFVWIKAAGLFEAVKQFETKYPFQDITKVEFIKNM